MNMKNLLAHLEKIAVEIGPRYGGSAGNHQAADYIAWIFTEAKLAVERQPFACPDWQERRVELRINDHKLPAVANAFSPPCDVTAQIVPVCTLAELAAADLTGKIGVLYGRLSQSPLSPKSWFLLSDEEKRLIALLEAKRPSALISVHVRPGELERLIEDWEFTYPSATVNAAVGQTLVQSQGATVRLKIESKSQDGYSENIVGRTTVNTAEKVVVCAHYDTKIDTPGAFDNGSGTAVLLSLAQSFSQESLPFALEFVAFSNEEYLPLGDDEYVQRAGKSFDQIIAAFNIDGVGQTIGSNSITTFACSENLQDKIAAVVKQYPGVSWVDPWPASNHYTFYSRGVPSIALGSIGHVHNIHLRSDTIEQLSPQKLAEVLNLTTALVKSLAGATREWTQG